MDLKESWTILGIDPTSDVRAVKAAYAKSVRSIDPETNPVSFSKLHTAYKEVLDSVKKQAENEHLRESSRKAGSFIPDTPNTEREVPRGRVSTLAFSYEESLLDDILQYKEDNQLSDELTLNMLEPYNRVRLIQGLKKRYKTVIDATDDISLWQSFLDEPLIKPLLNYSDVRQKIMENIGNSTKSHDELRKLMSGYTGFEKYLGKKAVPKTETRIEETVDTAASNKKKRRILITLLIIGIAIDIILMILGFVAQWVK